MTKHLLHQCVGTMHFNKMSYLKCRHVQYYVSSVLLRKIKKENDATFFIHDLKKNKYF